jgi:hypothetical protein
VFALLMAIVLQVAGHATHSTDRSTRDMEVSQMVRQTFDNLGQDLASIVANDGAVLVAGRTPTGWNPASVSLTFLCRARSSESAPVAAAGVRCTAVCYGVALFADREIGLTTAAAPMVARGYGVVPWSGTYANLANALGSASQAAQGGSGTIIDRFDPVAEDIFRMEVVYVLWDGRITPTPPKVMGFSSTPSLAGADAIDLSKIKAIVVGVASLDRKSREVLFRAKGDTGLQTLAKSFAAVTQDGQTPLDGWSVANVPTDFPPVVRAGVLFHQRTFTLHTEAAL